MKTVRNPLIMHQNYCEPDLSVGEACRYAQEWGFDGVEIRRCDLFRARPTSEYLEDVCRAFEKFQLSSVIIGAPAVDLMQCDADDRKSALDEALKFYEAASSCLPVTGINFLTGVIRNPKESIQAWELHGSSFASGEHWEWAIEGCRQVAAFAQEKGISAGLEIHANYLHDTIDSALALLELSRAPGLGLTLDLGNMLLMPESPTVKEMLERALPHTVLVHLKNVSISFEGSRFLTRLKDGQINHRAVLRDILNDGYKGPFVIEAPADGDRLAWGREDCAYIRSLLTE